MPPSDIEGDEKPAAGGQRPLGRAVGRGDPDVAVAHEQDRVGRRRRGGDQEDNEQRKAEGNFADGRQNGAWLYWYATGTPESQGMFAMGAKEGVWTTFQANGERSSEGQFVGGEEHGPWTFWNADVLTRTEGSFVLGDRDGIWLDYGPEDKPVRERIYRDGRMITMREL